MESRGGCQSLLFSGGHDMSSNLEYYKVFIMRESWADITLAAEKLCIPAGRQPGDPPA